MKMRFALIGSILIQLLLIPAVFASGGGDDIVPPTWIEFGIVTCSVDIPDAIKAMNIIVDRLSTDTLHANDAQVTDLFVDTDALEANRSIHSVLLQYRKTKMKCLTNVFNAHYGGALPLSVLAKQTDFIETLGYIFDAGQDLQKQHSGFCDAGAGKIREACVRKVVQRFERDAELGWAMAHYASSMDKWLRELSEQTLFDFSEAETR